MMDIVPGTLLAHVSDEGASHAEPPSSGNLQQFSNGSENDPGEPSRNRIILIVASVVITVATLVGVAGLVIYNFDDVQKLFSDDNQSVEQAYQNEDEDGDGLTTLEEITNGTKVAEADTDGDGMTDGFEVSFGLNPLDPLDASADEDEDGLNNADEFFYETLIYNPDTDSDGFKDGAEIAAGYNPNGPGELQKRLTREDFEGITSEAAVVNITSDGFDPDFIRVSAGENVTFINDDSLSHNVTGPEIETGNILPGKSFTIEFSSVGTFDFYDLEDESFKGKVVVLEQDQNPTSNSDEDQEAPQENTESQ